MTSLEIYQHIGVWVWTTSVGSVSESDNSVGVSFQHVRALSIAVSERRLKGDHVFPITQTTWLDSTITGIAEWVAKLSIYLYGPPHLLQC